MSDTSNFKFKTDVCFNNYKQNDLGVMFDKYGSNKGYSLFKTQQKSQHGMRYNEIYELLFCMIKTKVNLVLECGIGSKNPDIKGSIPHLKHNLPGGSLRAWSEYFTNAKIIGVDIDPDVLFSEEKIATYICDQTSKTSINNFINQAELQNNTVDIIIDDGLHEFNANITLFENTNKLLKKNGVYIIEDVWSTSRQLPQYIEYFDNLTGYDAKFVKVQQDYLIIITHQS
jgi:SAM-dependent methyltransferase